LSLTFGINRRIRPWHFGNRPKLSRGNDLAKAMDYMLKEHCRSTRYLGRASPETIYPIFAAINHPSDKQASRRNEKDGRRGR
jgi:hypothetical protein